MVAQMSTSNFGHLRMSTFMKVDIWSGHLGGVKVDISQAKKLDICATPHDSHGSGRRASAGDHVGAARLRALANPQLHAPGPSVSGTPYPLHRRTNIYQTLLIRRQSQTTSSLAAPEHPKRTFSV